MSQHPERQAPPPSYEWTMSHASAASGNFHPVQPPYPPPPEPAVATAPQPSAPEVDTELRQELGNWFSAVDEDGNGHITAQELQMALLDEDYKPFSITTCSMLVRMFDDNYNGEIEFDEFVQLYRYVQRCRQIFLGFDDDNSGTIELQELRAGLNQLHQPHSFSEGFCLRLIRKFSTHARSGSLSLDNFIEVSAALSKQLDNHRSVGASEPFESFASRALLH